VKSNTGSVEENPLCEFKPSKIPTNISAAFHEEQSMLKCCQREKFTKKIIHM